MKWRIFYVDDGTFSNRDGEPADAPGGGVLAIAQEDATVGVLIHRGNDFYCFSEEFGGWAGMDHFGLAQYLMRPGFKVIKLGEVMDTARYSEVLKAIRDDPNLPRKSARYPWEASS